MYQYLSGILTVIAINITAVCGLTILTGFTGMFSLGHAGFMSLGAYASVIAIKYWGFTFIPEVSLQHFSGCLSVTRQ